MISSKNQSSWKWINEGGVFYPVSEGIVIHNAVGNGVFELYKSDNPADGRIGLKKICDKFEFNFKIYDLGFDDLIETVIKTWNSDVYIESEKNLGVMLKDKAGAGKSIAAKILCNKLNIPVIIISKNIDGMVGFLEALDFEAVLLIDEADKIFNRDKENSDVLLRITEGVYNRARKLCLLTVNETCINSNMFSRPSRIRYIHSVGNLPSKTVSEFIDDNLKYPERKEDIIKFVDLLENSTIDILKAIIDEVNIFGELKEQNYLNVKKSRYVFDVIRFRDDETKLEGFKEYLRSTIKPGQTIKAWLADKSAEDEKQINEDYIYDVFDGWVDKLTSDTSTLWRGSMTNWGEVIEEPNKEDYVTIRPNGYDAANGLYIVKIINRRSNPSLYRGGLTV